MIDANHFWLLATALLSGVFWLIAYILIIYRGFKDKSYGMPIVALCGNLAWEIIFGLGIESGCPASWASCPSAVIQGRNFIWMLFDFVILYTVLKYGRHYYTYPFVKKNFTWIVLGGIAAAFLILYTTIQEFWIRNLWQVVVNGQIPEYLPLTLQGGSYYTGFGLNLIMSVLFVVMLFRRDNIDGQSFYIAASKWLGSVAAFAFMLADGIQTPVVNVLYAFVFLFDIVYMGLIYQKSRAQGVNPWRRA